MSHDLELAARVRDVLVGQPFTSKPLFGGHGFLLNGHAFCGIFKNKLMLHVASELTERRLTQEGAKPFVMRGNLMRGWLLLNPSCFKTKTELAALVNIALSHVQKIPVKPVKAPRPDASA